MASSILKYRTILGRTYHGERGNAQYWWVLMKLSQLHTQGGSRLRQGSPMKSSRTRLWTSSMLDMMAINI